MSLKPNSRAPWFDSSTSRAYLLRIGGAIACQPVHRSSSSCGSRDLAMRTPMLLDAQAVRRIALRADLALAVHAVERDRGLASSATSFGSVGLPLSLSSLNLRASAGGSASLSKRRAPTTKSLYFRLSRSLRLGRRERGVVVDVGLAAPSRRCTPSVSRAAELGLDLVHKGLRLGDGGRPGLGLARQAGDRDEGGGEQQGKAQAQERLLQNRRDRQDQDAHLVSGVAGGLGLAGGTRRGLLRGRLLLRARGRRLRGGRLAGARRSSPRRAPGPRRRREPEPAPARAPVRGKAPARAPPPCARRAGAWPAFLRAALPRPPRPPRLPRRPPGSRGEAASVVGLVGDVGVGVGRGLGRRVRRARRPATRAPRRRSARPRRRLLLGGVRQRGLRRLDHHRRLEVVAFGARRGGRRRERAPRPRGSRASVSPARCVTGSTSGAADACSCARARPARSRRGTRRRWTSRRGPSSGSRAPASPRAGRRSCGSRSRTR